MLYDNSALSNICKKPLDIDQPTHDNLNGVLAQAVAALTTSIRYEGAMNESLAELVRNLVPYPQVHFLNSSYSPFISAERGYLDQMTVPQMSHLLFEPANQLARVDTKEGKFMACSIGYRG